MQKNRTILLNDKNEFIAVDYFKIILALLVVSIHFHWAGSSNLVWYYFNELLLSTMVPLFFAFSGFFWSSKSTSKEKTALYLKRMCQLYLIYTIFSFPNILYQYVTSGDSVLVCIFNFVKSIFLEGTYLSLWYFSGLILSVSLLYFFINKLKLNDVVIALICIVLVLIKCIFIELPVFSGIMDFLNTRNGFFNMIFVFIGYIIGKNKYRIKNKKYIIFAVLTVIALLATIICADVFLKNEGVLLAIMMRIIKAIITALIIALTVLTVLFINTPLEKAEKGKLLRKYSTLIYTFHVLVGFYINAVLEHLLHISLPYFLFYVLVVAVTIIIATIIIKLSEKPKLKFLKNLY